MVRVEETTAAPVVSRDSGVPWTLCPRTVVSPGHRAQGVTWHAKAKPHGLLSCLHTSLQALAAQPLHVSPTALLQLSHLLITCSWRGAVPVLLLVPWRDLCEVSLVSRVQPLRPAGPQQHCQTTTETSLERGTKSHPVLGFSHQQLSLPSASLGTALRIPNPVEKMSSSLLLTNSGSCSLASNPRRQDIHPCPGEAAFPLAHLWGLLERRERCPGRVVPAPAPREPCQP